MSQSNPVPLFENCSRLLLKQKWVEGLFAFPKIQTGITVKIKIAIVYFGH